MDKESLDEESRVWKPVELQLWIGHGPWGHGPGAMGHGPWAMGIATALIS